MHDLLDLASTRIRTGIKLTASRNQVEETLENRSSCLSSLRIRHFGAPLVCVPKPFFDYPLNGGRFLRRLNVGLPLTSGEGVRLTRRVPLISLTLVAIAAAAGATRAAMAAGPAAQVSVGDRLTRSFDLAGRPLVIEASIGEIRVIAWNRPEVAVDTVRTLAGGTDADRLQLRIDEGPSVVRISALQADGGLDRNLRATITVQAPADARLESVRLVDGRVILTGLRGAVTADVRQGNIEGRHLSGTIRLETGFGDVDVREAELAPGGLLRLRAFNGDVRLHLAWVPEDARILALTFNGRITSDIPLTMKGAFGPRFAEARLGRGEPVISIDSVTGNIAITAKH